MMYNFNGAPDDVNRTYYVEFNWDTRLGEHKVTGYSIHYLTAF